MCRAGIIPLDNTSDIAGPLARTVEDVARMLEVLVAVDPNDPLTNLSKFLGSKSANYTSALSRDALKVPLAALSFQCCHCLCRGRSYDCAMYAWIHQMELGVKAWEKGCVGFF